MFSPELVAWELIRQPKIVWVCSLQNFHANFLDPPTPHTSARVQSCRNTATCRAWGAHGRATKGSLLRERSILGNGCGGSWRIIRKCGGFSAAFLSWKMLIWPCATKKNMKNTHSLKWWFNETVMKTRAENEFVNPDYQLGGLPQNSDKRLFEMVPHVNIPALD
jgi:hypothetical protein